MCVASPTAETRDLFSGFWLPCLALGWMPKVSPLQTPPPHQPHSPKSRLCKNHKANNKLQNNKKKQTPIVLSRCRALAFCLATVLRTVNSKQHDANLLLPVRGIRATGLYPLVKRLFYAGWLQIASVTILSLPSLSPSRDIISTLSRTTLRGLSWLRNSG